MHRHQRGLGDRHVLLPRAAAALQKRVWQSQVGGARSHRRHVDLHPAPAPPAPPCSPALAWMVEKGAPTTRWPAANLEAPRAVGHEGAHALETWGAGELAPRRETRVHSCRQQRAAGAPPSVRLGPGPWRRRRASAADRSGALSMNDTGWQQCGSPARHIPPAFLLCNNSSVLTQQRQQPQRQQRLQTTGSPWIEKTSAGLTGRRWMRTSTSPWRGREGCKLAR